MSSVKIAVICSEKLPVPAVKGGAISTLVNALVDQNEKNGMYEFVIFTGVNPEIDGLCDYSHTKVIQVKKTFFEKCCYLAFRGVRKMLRLNKPVYTPYVLAVNKQLRKIDYDILLFENSYNDALRVEKKNGCKMIYHVHSDYINDMQYNKMLENRFDHFFVISRFLKRRLIETQIIGEEKISVFENAIDVEKYANSIDVQKRAELRAKYGLSKDDFVFVYVGRLSLEKGSLELIKAFKQSKTNAKLLIIGGENFSSNKITPYVAKLKVEAVEAGDSIIFTGHVPHKKTVDIIKACDVGVIPSICNEACSLALLEFRAIGIPTIAFNVGAIHEFCDESTTCLVEYNNEAIRNLSDAIIAFQDKNLHNSMKQHASCDMETYDYPSYYKRFTKLVAEISSD